MKEIFPGVFREGRRLYTLSAAPGVRVYGEDIKKEKGEEYRDWSPRRSKLAAALANNLRAFPFAKDSIVLYLGASTGTTVSHLSDIATGGIIYAVEFSERMFRSLSALSKQQSNIAPLLFDARLPEAYRWVEECNIVYADIAQPDQTSVAMRNADMFLKKGGFLFVAVKSQSIDVTKAPGNIYEQEKKRLEAGGYSVAELIDLEPHEEKHCMLVARK